MFTRMLSTRLNLMLSTPRLQCQRTYVKSQVGSRIQQYFISRNSQICKTEQFTTRSFHTTRRQDVNPLLLVILRPVSKIAAALFGRGVRKWWQSLPKEKRQIFTEHFKRTKWRYFIGCCLISGCGYVYYDDHVVTVPFTKRKRFMVFTPEQLHTLSLHSYDELVSEHATSMCAENDPIVHRVFNITNKLLRSNKNIAQIYTKTWTVTVIDSPIENCLVLASGHIVVFRGMVELTQTDDQLAAVIAHEMSHAILGHTAELLSQTHLLTWLSLLPFVVVWAFIPSDGIAVITHWFVNRVIEILATLPYSRKLELEADSFGLLLTAGACFDVRDASALWGMLSVTGKIRGLSNQNDDQSADTPAWLSTHPSHNQRQVYLDNVMPAALDYRSSCKCPELKMLDPRCEVWKLQKKYLGTCPSEETELLSGSTNQLEASEAKRLWTQMVA